MTVVKTSAPGLTILVFVSIKYYSVHKLYNGLRVVSALSVFGNVAGIFLGNCDLLL